LSEDAAMDAAGFLLRNMLGLQPAEHMRQWQLLWLTAAFHMLTLLQQMLPLLLLCLSSFPLT
jgi:hypothetical protein